MSDLNTTEETIEEYYDRVSSKWKTIADRALLNTALQKIQEMDSDVGSADSQVSQIRAGGYVFNKDWENTIKEVQRRWPQERRIASREHENRAQTLSQDARRLDSQLRRASRNRNLLSQFESDAETFEKQVNGAEQYVLGTFERSSSQLGDIWSGLEWAEFLLDNLRSASFKLVPNENGVAAAKAEWVSEKKKPEGTRDLNIVPCIKCVSHRKGSS